MVRAVRVAVVSLLLGVFLVVPAAMVASATGAVTSPPAFSPVTPARLMDTRLGLGGVALAPGETRSLTVAGAGGVPSVGVGAVSLNVTVVGPSAAGYLTVYPTGVPLPTASNLNFTAGQVVPNAVTVGLGEGGRISLFNPSGTTPVIVDVTGWLARNLAIGAEKDPPEVAITSPATGAIIDLGVTGSFSLQGTAFDSGSGIAALDILVGNEVIAAGVPVDADYHWSVELAALSSGAVTYRAMATDRAGNTAFTDRQLLPQLPAPDATVLAGHVDQFTGAGAADVTSFDSDTGQMRLAGDKTGTIGIGDPVVADPSAAAPDGLLRRITGVSLVGADTVLATEPAVITDVVLQGNADLDEPLEDPTAMRTAAAAADVTRPLASVSGDLSLTTGRATLAANAAAKLVGRFHIKIEVHLKLKWFGRPTGDVKTLEMWVSTNASVDASGTMSTGVEGTNTRQLLDKKLPKIKFSIGWFPVWIQPEVIVKIGATVKTSGSLTWSWGITETWRAGLRYTKADGWGSVADHTETSRGTGPTPQARVAASVDVYVDAQIKTRFYSVAGPFLGVTPHLEASVDAAVSRTAPTMNWNLGVSLSGRVGADVRIPIINRELASYDREIFNLQETLESGTVAAPAVFTTQSLGADIAAGTVHTCALVSGGQVRCWGSNVGGELGDGTTTDSGVPVTVAGLSGVTAISSGQNHTCVVVSGGEVRCWGVGPLGNGTNTSSAVPITVSGLSGVTAIASGFGHTCAVTSGGEVRCWGDNSAGQLGDGTTTASLVPVTVTGLTGATAVSVGGDTTCALVAAGEGRCWGSGSGGKLGDGTFDIPSTSPVAVAGLRGATAISVGFYTSCALVSQGDVRCWGKTPGPYFMHSAVPVTVTGLTGATAVSVGFDTACALVAAGEGRCWGSGEFGVLGNGTTVESKVPVAVTGLTGATKISVSVEGQHACAVAQEQRLFCWGHNGSGQLGDGTTTDSSIPAAVRP